MKLYDVLFEKRAQADRNVKESPLDQLKALYGQYGDSLYVSFTEIEKVGVNPQSSYATPFGVYTYPIKYVIDNEVHKVPHASYASFLQVLKKNEGAVVWDLSDPLTSAELFERINTATEKVTGNPIRGAILAKRTQYNTTDVWYGMYDKLGYNNGDDDEDADSETKAALGKGALRILRLAGIDVVHDTKGTIHENEPVQTLFLNPKSYTRVAQLRNISPAAIRSFKYSLPATSDLGAILKDIVAKKRRSSLVERNVDQLVADSSNVPYLVKYAAEVHGQRWPALEHALIVKKDVYGLYIYARQFKLTAWPEAIELIRDMAHDTSLTPFVKSYITSLQTQLKS